MQVVAIIPARGGSVGVVRKNVQPVGGKPLVTRTIEAAKASKAVSRVVVSTDCYEIADAATAAGAEIVWRPAELATDTATSESVLLHVLETLARQGYEPDLVVFLQCTSPFTTGEDIHGTIAALVDQNADTALTVADFPYFLWRLDGTAIGHDKSKRLRRQDRTADDRNVIETGAVYVMRTAGFMQHRHRFFGRTVVYETSTDRLCEIDEPADLVVAEALFTARRNAAQASKLPPKVKALVLDFDGVLTDDHVSVSETGMETVRCSRSDGAGISMLRNRGVQVVVISAETNGVVAARCEKLEIESMTGVKDKLPALEWWCAENMIDPSQCVYVGNDRNDLECMQAVGCGVAVSNAHPSALQAAKLVLQSRGGEGAVREICELILASAV